MNRRSQGRFFTASLLVMLLTCLELTPVAAVDAVVRGVLFWAEGCPACHAVLTEFLPQLQARYGDQLDIQLIQVSETLNYDYFREIEDLYEVSAGRRGVPALFIGDQLLVGEHEISERLPALIERYLAAGGVDYPPLPDLAAHFGTSTSPGLEELAASAGEEVLRDGICVLATPCADEGQAVGASADVGGPASRPDAQPSEAGGGGFDGQWLGIIVMVILLLALAYSLLGTAVTGLGRPFPVFSERADILIPILAVLGIGVASYLTFVEAANVSAVCGPVGDCNEVQSSPYAKLFGVVPVGLLGLFGYIGIIVAWLLTRHGRGELARLAALAMVGMALFGVLFTIYLTYLELFVILAVCAWCLASAVIMSLVLVLAMGPAVDVLLEA